jgi:preprotein translocase subunit SecG
MLSYLKEGQSKTAAADPTPIELAGEDAALSRQDDYLTVSGHGQKLRQSTILLMALFAVGVLGVWFMIKKTTPAQAAAANDDQAQIEAAIAQLNGMQSEMNTQMDSVVGRFYQYSNVGQIGVEELKKNPFKRELGAGQVALEEKDQRRTKLQLLEDNVRRASAGMQLWSVTATPRGACCMINDRVLYAGDEINGLTVKSINKKSVVLELEGVCVELKMDE